MAVGGDGRPATDGATGPACRPDAEAGSASVKFWGCGVGATIREA
jgi:hypothetical protein